MSRDVFESAVRIAGDLAGVFEGDNDADFFYLYDLRKPESERVVAAIPVRCGVTATELRIRWSRDQDTVALFSLGECLAAFRTDTQGSILPVPHGSAVLQDEHFLSSFD
jgi:hypothetical protein